MNLFESLSLQIGLMAAAFTTLFVSAATVTFNKYFEVERRVKLLVLFTSIFAAALNVSFDFSNLQIFISQIVVVISFSVLFYHYLGGKYVRSLFQYLKTKLPGAKNDDQ